MGEKRVEQRPYAPQIELRVVPRNTPPSPSRSSVLPGGSGRYTPEASLGMRAEAPRGSFEASRRRRASGTGPCHWQRADCVGGMGASMMQTGITKLVHSFRGVPIVAVASSEYEWRSPTPAKNENRSGDLSVA